MYYRFFIPYVLWVSYDTTHLTLFRPLELVLLPFECKRNSFKFSLFPLWWFTSFSFICDNFLLLITFLPPTRAFENPNSWDTWSLRFFWLFSAEKSSKYQDFGNIKWEIWDKWHTWILKIAPLYGQKSSIYNINNIKKELLLKMSAWLNIPKIRLAIYN